MEQREYENMVKKEMEMMKREERLENVDRISRANDHKKHKILDKIDFQ